MIQSSASYDLWASSYFCFKYWAGSTLPTPGQIPKKETDWRKLITMQPQDTCLPSPKGELVSKGNYYLFSLPAAAVGPFPGPKLLPEFLVWYFVNFYWLKKPRTLVSNILSRDGGIASLTGHQLSDSDSPPSVPNNYTSFKPRPSSEISQNISSRTAPSVTPHVVFWEGSTLALEAGKVSGFQVGWSEMLGLGNKL